MVWLGYLIAMICVRYRDIIQVITTWLHGPILYHAGDVEARISFRASII